MTNKYVRNEENPGAVINTDITALQNYKKRKEIAARNRQEIEDMKTDISEIKKMLVQLMELKNNGS